MLFRSSAPNAASFSGTVDLDCDLLVLGAGPGGYSAAFRAADLGLRVVLADAAHGRHLAHFGHGGKAAMLGVALHQYDLEAQVGSAKRRRIAAGAEAQHEQVTVQINRAGEAGGIGYGCALSNRARG